MYFGEGRYFKCFLFVKMILCCGIYHTSKSSVYQIHVEYQSSKMYLPPSLKQKGKPYRCLRCHCDPSQDSTLPSAFRSLLVLFPYLGVWPQTTHCLVLSVFALYTNGFLYYLHSSVICLFVSSLYMLFRFILDAT